MAKTDEMVEKFIDNWVDPRWEDTDEMRMRADLQEIIEEARKKIDPQMIAQQNK